MRATITVPLRQRVSPFICTALTLHLCKPREISDGTRRRSAVVALISRAVDGRRWHRPAAHYKR